jgi:hypothetical protein
MENQENINSDQETRYTRLKDYHREKILDYLGSGKLCLARDLCMGLIGKYRYNEELYRIGAKIWYDLGDLPRAGLYWMLTLEESPQAEESIQAAIKKYGVDLDDHIRLYDRYTYVMIPGEITKRLNSALVEAGSRDVDTIFKLKRTECPAGKMKLFEWGCITAIVLFLAIFFGGIIFWLRAIF